MPYRKKKNWVRFLKKIRAADKNNLGSLVKIINDSVVTSPRTTSQEQSVCAISLYGGSGTNAAETTGNRDMRDLIAEMVAGAGNTYNITNGAKFNFYSAVMDLTIVNEASDEELLSQLMEVDLYEISYRRTTSDDVNNISALYAAALGDTLELGTGAKPQITFRGVTPFELTQAIRAGGLKILKKTKYFIPANGAVTYQYRDPRNWMMTPKGLDADDYRIQGRTRTLLIIAKPVDSANIDQGLRVGVTRTYKFTIQNTNVVDRGSWN